jgi:predicted S18 family serine protease
MTAGPILFICYRTPQQLSSSPMKVLLTLLGLLTLATAPALAQCKACGCQAKCSPTCECKHDEKPQVQ